MDQTGIGNLMPHNLEAERAVLGALLVDSELTGVVSEILPHPELFYRTAHQQLYSVMMEMYDQRRPVDLLILTEELDNRGLLAEVGGRTALMDLVAVEEAAHVEHHAHIVRGRSTVRRLIHAGQEIQRACREESHDISRLVDHCERVMYDVTQDRARTDVYTMKDLVDEAIDQIREISRTKGAAFHGLPTGFYELDQMTAGLQKSELIIIAARPSMGKTTFMLNLVEQVALSGAGVAIFSIEVARDQLVRNMLCSLAMVNSQDLRTGTIHQEDYEALWKAANQLHQAPVFINDQPGISIMALRSAARRLKQRHDIGLITIDYLQLMEGSQSTKGESRQQEITEISRGLKALARELEIPVIALSQLNRNVDQRENHRPRMSDLRESGSIEQEADLIMFLYRDEYYFKEESEKKGMAEVIIAKQRHGPTGSVELQFAGEIGRFRNLAHYAQS